MALTLREKVTTYLVVGFFAIVLAFPFYWMLTTALKPIGDLLNVQNLPFWFHPGPTLAELPEPLRHELPALAREHGDRRSGRRRDHARARAPGRATRSRACPVASAARSASRSS